MKHIFRNSHIKYTGILKYILFFLFVNISTAFTNIYAQESVSLNIKGTIKEAMLSIEKQTGYNFVYNVDETNLSKPLTVQLQAVPLKKALDTIFLTNDISYKIFESHIALYSNTKSNEILIKAKIIDEKGEPIIGATIAVDKSKKMTITDIYGYFTLKVPLNSKITISYIGYITKVISCDKERNLEIVLQEDSQALDEVVVVGYGTSTKRSLISSVSNIKSKQLENLPISNISQGLAGRAAGLIVQGSGGGINKTATISIRGGGTPLIVINGIIRNYEDFLTLSPDDIESLSVLKDASATAVYGSRAANGIIQITTKEGKEGAPQIDYSYNYSLSEPANWKRPLNSWDRVKYANIAKKNHGLEPSFSDDQIKKMQDGSDLLQYGNVNWRDLVLRDFAPQTKHSLRMVGGKETNNYYISLSSLDQESLYKSNNYNMHRTNFRVSQSATIAAIGLKYTATIDGYIQRIRHPNSSSASGAGAIFSHIQNMSPLTPGVNKFGLPYNIGDNPVAETAKDAGYSKSAKRMVNGNLQIQWKVPKVKGLLLKAGGNYRYGFDDVKNWRKDAAKYNYDSKEPMYDNLPSLSNSTNYGYTYTLQFFANYARSFGAHSISALAGYESTYGYGKGYWLSRENYKFPIDQINVGPEDTQKNGGSESESGRAGYVAQLKYNYNNKYFAEFGLRYDGSDNFPKGKRWGTFYSTSLGWSIADESFMEILRKKNIINSLKLRASYGEVGLDNWGKPFNIGRFEYLSSYNLDNKAWVLNGAYTPGFSEGAIPSPDISWFTTNQYDVGFDFASLENRLYGSIDYFYYKTKGFLYAPNQIDVGYIEPLGMSLPKVSTDGEHRRAGFDFTLGWRDHINDFNYDVSTNVTKFDQLWANNPSRSINTLMNPYKRQTQQVGFYGNLYRNLGYYTSEEDVLNNPKRLGSYNLTAGDIKYNDFNGDGKLDGSDQIRSGKSSFPRANYGININMNYKGIYLSMLFQGATRYDMYLTGTAQMNGGQTGQLPIIYGYQTDFWQPSNTNAKYPRLMAGGGLNGNNNYVSSDFWLINGAYFRMKDIQISYDLKYAVLNRLKWLKKARISLSGQNIFTLSEATNYGLDPENSSVEHYGYPNERIYALSINLGF